MQANEITIAVVAACTSAKSGKPDLPIIAAAAGITHLIWSSKDRYYDDDAA